MDVKMPRMTGIEALAALRRDERTRATPVILISAGTRLAAEFSDLLTMADDFVAKPFDPDTLLARVRAALGRTRPASE
jgi:two-component system phosphate regulon response regulator PhoB